MPPRAVRLPAVLLLAAACAAPPDYPGERLVDIAEADPAIAVDIRYSTKDNFAGRRLYPANRCLLRASAARALSRARARLSRRGLSLKVWDCYRPLSVQRRLWAVKPDPRYVADPAKGSRHNRGGAVDVTLIDARGLELEMPTGYDDFSEKAHRGYSGASPAAIRNRGILERALAAEGFTGLRTEWWHFDARGSRDFPILDVPLEAPLR